MSQSEYLPHHSNVFNAFSLNPDNVKVVILGQDPYHTPGLAHGYAFSALPSRKTKTPPSLVNIFREYMDDLDLPKPRGSDLRVWSEQLRGVLLLNTALTVRAGVPDSHSNVGWGKLTFEVLSHLSRDRKGLAFLLWGNHAKDYMGGLDTSNHLVLTAPHPSPFSAHKGFFGCKHFSKTAEYLNIPKEKLWLLP